LEVVKTWQTKRTKVKALTSSNSVSSPDKAKAKEKTKGRDRAKVTSNAVVTRELSRRIRVKTKKENRRKTRQTRTAPYNFITFFEGAVFYSRLE
jgi:hypothetical protein